MTKHFLTWYDITSSFGKIITYEKNKDDEVISDYSFESHDLEKDEKILKESLENWKQEILRKTKGTFEFMTLDLKPKVEVNLSSLLEYILHPSVEVYYDWEEPPTDDEKNEEDNNDKIHFDMENLNRNPNKTNSSFFQYNEWSKLFNENHRQQANPLKQKRSVIFPTNLNERVASYFLQKIHDIGPSKFSYLSDHKIATYFMENKKLVLPQKKRFLNARDAGTNVGKKITTLSYSPENEIQVLFCSYEKGIERVDYSGILLLYSSSTKFFNMKTLEKMKIEQNQRENFKPNYVFGTFAIKERQEKEGKSIKDGHYCCLYSDYVFGYLET